MSFSFRLLQFFFNPVPGRDVLDGEQDQFFRGALLPDAPGVQQHNALADGGELVLHPVILKRGFLGQDLFQQRSQLRDIPLVVSQFIDEAVARLFG